MQNDETIWHCINQDFCSFKVKLKQPETTFCKNKHNVTGLCTRVSCPLANSQYATVMEEEGVCYLYMKTVERAHTPSKLWEKVKLSRNFLEALEQISKQMEYWPEHMINRCKQRLTKMRQMLIRMRKLSQQEGTRLVPIKKKTEKRERARELKAETAALVDLAIEKELLERLKQGTYGDIYNFPSKNFEKVLDGDNVQEAEPEEDELTDTEFVEDMGEDESDEDQVQQVEIEDETELMMQCNGDDLEQLQNIARPFKRKGGRAASGGKKKRIEIEYENEMEAGAVF